jgi:hypothetical protein
MGIIGAGTIIGTIITGVGTIITGIVTTGKAVWRYRPACCVRRPLCRAAAKS